MNIISTLFKPAKQKRVGIFKRTQKLSNPMNIISASGPIKRAAPQSNLFKPAKQKRAGPERLMAAPKRARLFF